MTNIRRNTFSELLFLYWNQALRKHVQDSIKLKCRHNLYEYTVVWENALSDEEISPERISTYGARDTVSLDSDSIIILSFFFLISIGNKGIMYLTEAVVFCSRLRWTRSRFNSSSILECFTLTSSLRNRNAGILYGLLNALHRGTSRKLTTTFPFSEFTRHPLCLYDFDQRNCNYITLKWIETICLWKFGLYMY